jgi:PII-like signaling protein
MDLPQHGPGDVREDEPPQLRLTADDRHLNVVEAELLRVFVGTEQKYRHKPLYEAIVLAARERHLAGATVLHGSMGYGAASRIHTSKILRISEDLPIVVEIVDTPQKIEAFVPVVDSMMEKGLITVETVKVIAYRHGTS